MTYQFEINDEIFNGRTIPGAARMRIFHQASGQFLVAFDPDVESLRSERPTGIWVDVSAKIDPNFLERLKPEVITACQARLRYFDEAKRKISQPPQSSQ